MTKTDAETIEKFNEQVNMTAEELQIWIDSDTSEDAGAGVGQESGRKIIEILKKNPNKDPAIYEADDLAHMHEVVAYISTHLAKEEPLQDTKTKEELEKAESTISLRNWGHDPIKTLDSAGPSAAAVEPTSETVEAAEGKSTEEEETLKRKAEQDPIPATEEAGKEAPESAEKPLSTTEQPPAKKAKKTPTKGGAKKAKKTGEEVAQGTRKSGRSRKSVDYAE